jgi:hypothetical protein
MVLTPGTQCTELTTLLIAGSNSGDYLISLTYDAAHLDSQVLPF